MKALGQSFPYLISFFNLVSFKGKILSVKVEKQGFSYCWSSDPYSSKSNFSTDCPGKFKLGPFKSSWSEPFIPRKLF